MLGLAGGLLLFAALATAIPTDRAKLSNAAQQIITSHQLGQQGYGNPRKLKGKFLHITDFHLDLFYKSGASADPHHPCHHGHGHNSTGYYGAPTTSCDSPLTLADATFDWIEKNIKDEIDFVIWTGDSARHDSDDDFPRHSDQVLQLNRIVADGFARVFGKEDVGNDPDPMNSFVIPIVPNIGNNDFLPHNIFLPGPNTWTRAYLNMWRHFVPAPQKHSFARGGWFWTEVIPNKLAVVSLNTMYFFGSNSAVDGCDAESEPGYEQMEWLRVQLQFFRERGLKVIIIGHVPPARTENKKMWDESCYQKYVLWQRQYRDIIVTNLYGHMNVDHFMVHDVKDLKYDFDIDGIDESLRSSEQSGNSISNEDFEILAKKKTQYMRDLRSTWSNLPLPPQGFPEFQNNVSLEDCSELNAEHQRNYVDEIGGAHGERFSVSFVSPSIVPNYFPGMRIIEYNATGLENDHPALIPFQGHPHLTTGNGQDEKSFSMSKSSSFRKGKPNFEVPIPPSKTSLPGPAHSPQTFSLTSWTQLYANLTKINEQTSEESGHGHLEYEVEYTTNHHDVYRFRDLTVKNWLALAQRISRPYYEHTYVVDDSEFDTGKAGEDSKNDVSRETGQFWHNKLWHEFVRRAFVSSRSDRELAEDFDY